MNEQELFWKGQFGDDYIGRNSLNNVSKTIAQWAKMLAKLPAVPESMLELGCNIGINLHALSVLLPETELNAVEINTTAARQAQESLGDRAKIFEGSLLSYTPNRQYDLSFTCGVLIHIAPEFLPQAYETLYKTSSRYILVKEYYNPTPVEVPYRGYSEKLFKRDFCGDLLDKYGDLRLVDYGFIYHRDALFPADDATWFLLEKKPC